MVAGSNTDNPASPEFLARIGLGGGKSFQIHTIKDEGTPYVKKSGAVAAIVGRFIFPGTNVVGSPAAITAIMWEKDGTGKTAQVVIYDVTNANNIATLTTTNGTPIIVTDSTLTNLPAAEAIFEIRLSSPDSGEGRLTCVEVRF